MIQFRPRSKPTRLKVKSSEEILAESKRQRIETMKTVEKYKKNHNKND
ncbi:hypothetical protein ACSVDA_19595 [Cytobacillus sp. Hm23]